MSEIGWCVLQLVLLCSPDDRSPNLLSTYGLLSFSRLKFTKGWAITNSHLGDVIHGELRYIQSQIHKCQSGNNSSIRVENFTLYTYMGESFHESMLHQLLSRLQFFFMCVSYETAVSYAAYVSFANSRVLRKICAEKWGNGWLIAGQTTDRHLLRRQLIIVLRHIFFCAVT